MDTQTVDKKNKVKASKGFKPIEIAYVGIFTAIIAIFSWISIPTAVPFTLQTFAVFLALGILGGKLGFFSVLVYIILGAVGIPVFAGFSGGMSHLLGTTGGYIVGFLLLAGAYWLITALAGEKFYIKIIGMVVGLLLCYTFGTAWFMYVYIAKNGPVTLMRVLGWCVFPFIIPDAVKLALAIIISSKLSKFIKK
jgi:biotin transport system substrate-specific component